MLKTMLLALGVAFAATSTVTPASAWDLTELNKRVDENLFQIGEGCSGTLVNVQERLIITAYHCISDSVKTKENQKRDEDGAPLMGPNGEPIKEREKVLLDVPVHQLFPNDQFVEEKVTYYSKIVARDADLDVAVLQIPRKVGPVNVFVNFSTTDVPLAPKDYKYVRGATVWDIANPRMLYGTVTKGIISSSARSLEKYGLDKQFYVQYDGGIVGGSSGGALYDDNGKFIGVNDMVVLDPTGSQIGFLGLVVPIQSVWKVLEDNCLATMFGGTNKINCKNTNLKPSSDKVNDK